MKWIRVLVAGLAAAVLAGCSQSMTGMVDLDPVSYRFHPPAGLGAKLSVEVMTGQWADEAFAAGVESFSYVIYTPDEGQDTGLMGVYYMPESVFNGLANPNEPPLDGSEVTRADGFVLSVAGPQDSIYDPETVDGKNTSLLYEALYDPKSYTHQ
jgi:hypothetical protein